MKKIIFILIILISVILGFLIYNGRNKDVLEGTCTINITNNESVVDVTSNQYIVKYIYNDIVSNKNRFVFKYLIEDVNVSIINANNEKLDLKCKINNTGSNVDTSSEYIPSNPIEPTKPEDPIKTEEPNLNPKKELEIHFIPSGHYDDAILIKSGDKVIFIDGGRYDCKDSVLPYLDKNGITTIDLLIGSHLHNDHIAAQAAIIEKYDVKKIYYPDSIFDCYKKGTCDSEDQQYIVNTLNKYGKIPEIINPGTLKSIDDINLYFIGPNSISSSQNSNSLIFILKFINNTFMFTGDGILYLNNLKKYADNLNISLDVDLLKYPHHGNSTISETVLKALTPNYIIVPNYKASKYPNSSNLSLIKKYSKVYRQSDTPNIIIKSDGNNIVINAY